MQKKKHTKTKKKQNIENEETQYLEKMAKNFLENHLSPVKKDSKYKISSVIDPILGIGMHVKPKEIQIDGI